MKTAIDTPGELYRSVKVRAAQEESTVREIVFAGMRLRLHSEQGNELREEEGMRPPAGASSKRLLATKLESKRFRVEPEGGTVNQDESDQLQ